MDNFGRLPTDVLKYISFLGVNAPYFTYKTHKLILHTTGVKHMYKLCSDSQYKDELSLILDGFGDYLAYLRLFSAHCHEIAMITDYKKQYIVINYVSQSLKLPYSVLPSLKKALLLYINDV
jgi:hypothetical protein